MSTDPAPQHGTTAPDPSMDDILASIRRILDEEGQRQGPEAEAAPHAPAESDDVLELDQFEVLPDPDPAAGGPVPAPPPILAEPAAVTEPPPAPPLPEPPTPAPLAPSLAAPLGAPLVAPAAAAAAAVSVGALMRTLASERSTAVHRGGPTIEDLVREEVRPLLKDWLDTHLPPLVERLVRAEIERVVSRMT